MSEKHGLSSRRSALSRLAMAREGLSRLASEPMESAPPCPTSPRGEYPQPGLPQAEIPQAAIPAPAEPAQPDKPTTDYAAWRDDSLSSYFKAIGIENPAAPEAPEVSVEAAAHVAGSQVTDFGFDLDADDQIAFVDDFDIDGLAPKGLAGDASPATRDDGEEDFNSNELFDLVDCDAGPRPPNPEGGVCSTTEEMVTAAPECAPEYAPESANDGLLMDAVISNMPEDALAPRARPDEGEQVDIVSDQMDVSDDDSADAADIALGTSIETEDLRFGYVFDESRSELLRHTAETMGCAPEDVVVTALDWYLDALLGESAA